MEHSAFFTPVAPPPILSQSTQREGLVGSGGKLFPTATLAPGWRDGARAVSVLVV